MTDTAAATLQPDIEREQWSVLLDNARSSTVPTAMIGAVFAAFYTFYADIHAAWWWWLALVSLLVLRVRFAGHMRAQTLPPTARNDAAFHVLMFMLGTLWGLVPVLISQIADNVVTFTALLLAGGMAIKGFVVYGIRQSVALVFTAPIGVLCVAGIAATGERSYYLIGVALVLLYAHQYFVMWQTRRVLQNQIQSRVENAARAAQLGHEAELSHAEIERHVITERNLRASRDEAERLSATDAMTEIANRRHFDKRLKSEVSRASRAHAHLSLVLGDIDYFKQFNDIYGHQNGDECIKALARALEANCRRGGDLAARIGGEEFALLLPTTDHVAALNLAEKVRASFAAFAIAHAGNKAAPHATVSFGVSTIVPENLDAGEALMRSADRALYLAKERGRNQVRSEQEVGEPAA